MKYLILALCLGAALSAQVSSSFELTQGYQDLMDALDSLGYDSDSIVALLQDTIIVEAARDTLTPVADTLTCNGDTVGVSLSDAVAIFITNPSDVAVHWRIATSGGWRYLGKSGNSYSMAPPGYAAAIFDTLMVTAPDTAEVYYEVW